MTDKADSQACIFLGFQSNNLSLSLHVPLCVKIHRLSFSVIVYRQQLPDYILYGEYLAMDKTFTPSPAALGVFIKVFPVTLFLKSHLDDHCLKFLPTIKYLCVCWT